MAWNDPACEDESTNKASFMVISTDSIGISTDEDASTFITGLSFEESSAHWQLESTFGGVRNVSGRTLSVLQGLVSTHAVSANAAAKIVFVFSERSSDNGATWIKNELSGRKGTIASTSEEYGSKSSEAFDVADNEIIRFKFFTDGANVSLEPVSFAADSDTVTGPSFRWRLREA